MDKERDAHRDRERYEGMTERQTEIDREGKEKVLEKKRKRGKFRLEKVFLRKIVSKIRQRYREKG